MSTLYGITDGIVIEGTVPAPGTIVLTDGTNTVTLGAPTGLASSYTLELPPSSGGTRDILTLTSATTSAWAPVPTLKNMWYISDQKTSGTDGGPIAPQTWQQRELNTISTVSGTGTDVQLAVAPAGINQLLIQAGTYRIMVEVPLTNRLLHQCKVRNITDATDEILGSTSASTPFNLGNTQKSFIDNILIVPSAKVYDIQQYSSSTALGSATNLGAATGITGFPEIYTQVKIEKLA